MNGAEKKLKVSIIQSIVILFVVMAIGGTFFCTQVFAETAQEETAAANDANAGAVKYSMIAAAIAFGLGALGAGIAISHVGAAAMGAIAEKPQIAGQALIFVALAEGLVVFGFITALMILNKV